MLNALERKVLRKIYGPLRVNGHWRNRYDDEICKLYKEVELSRNIRWRRLQRVGHAIRVMDERVSEKSLNGYIEGRRPVGRPGGRCSDAVDRDVQMLRGCLNAGSGESRQRIQMPGGGGLKMRGGGGLKRPGGGGLKRPGGGGLNVIK